MIQKPLISVIPVYMTYVDEKATIPQYMEFRSHKLMMISIDFIYLLAYISHSTST